MKFILFFKDSKGNIWLGTHKGLSLYKNGRIIDIKNELPNDLEYLAVLAIEEMPDGELLIGTWFGLFIYKNGGYKNFGREIGLPDYEVQSIEIQDRNIWIGFYGLGICKYNLDTKDKKFISDDDGLKSNLIYSLRFINEELWVGSMLGLCKIRFDYNGDILKIRDYDISDGFFGKTIPNHTGIYVDLNKNIWLSSSKGAHQYMPEYDKSDKYEPRLHITSLNLFNSKQNWSEQNNTRSWFNMPAELELQWNSNSLTFSYIGLSYKDPQQVRYKYKLENFDEDWLPETKNTTASYSNLPHGEYTFKVKAANAQGVWTIRPVEYSFIIKPPFWKTWWFHMMLAISLLLIVFYLINNYKYKSMVGKQLAINRAEQQAIYRTRKKMVRDFQHEIGNRLASLAVSSNVLIHQFKGLGNGTEDYISKIEDNSKNIYGDIKDFVWSLDPENGNLAELYDYIREYGEGCFSRGEKEFISHTNVYDFCGISLDPSWNRQILRIFKDLISYGHDLGLGDAHLDLLREDNYFRIEFYEKNLSSLKKENLWNDLTSRAQTIQGSLSLNQLHEQDQIIFISGKLNMNSEETFK